MAALRLERPVGAFSPSEKNTQKTAPSEQHLQ